MQQLFNLSCDVFKLLRGLETGYHLSALVDEELREVPLDVGTLLVVGVGLRQHVVEDVCDGVLHVPTGKALLLLEELEERVGIVAVHLHLLEAGEVGAEGELAEFVDALVGAGCLLTELVAGEVENGESL